MSRQLTNVKKFLKTFRESTEAKVELFVGVGLYVMFTFVVTKALDVWLDRFFDLVEKIDSASTNIIAPDNKAWLFIQTTTQLVLSVVLSYVITQLVHYLLIPLNKVDPVGFGLFDKTAAGKIIFATMLFFTQDNLRAKLKLLVPNFQ